MGYIFRPLRLGKNYSASDDLLIENTGAGVTTSDTYVPLDNTKLTLVRYIYSDSLFRFKFDMKDNGAIGHIVKAKIYKNGAELGSEQSTNSQVYVTKSEDIVATGWKRGDVLQVYGHRTTPQGAPKVTKMSLYGSGSEWERG